MTYKHLLRLIIIALTLPLMVLLPTGSRFAAAAPTVSASIEPQQGTVQDIFVIEVTVKEIPESQLTEPVFDPSPNFRIERSGTSSSLQIVNGKQSQSFTYSFLVYPQSSLNPGTYQLPLGRIAINNRLLQLNSLSVEIVSAEAVSSPHSSSSGQHVSFTQHVDLLEPYVGQQITYRAEIAADSSLSRGTLSKLDISGFWREQIRDGEPKQRRRGNLTVQSIVEVLVPTQSGVLTIPERILEAKLQRPRERQRRLGFGRSPFDDSFFQGWPFITDDLVTKRYVAPALTVNVKPLPPAPASEQDYIPVGKITLLSKLTKHKLSQGESLTMKIKLSGDGNLRPLELSTSHLQSKKEFRVYVDKPNLSTSVRGDKILYTKVFKLALVALQSGKLEVPVFRILTFDPERREYVHLETPQDFIDVLPDTSENQLIISGIQSEPHENLKPEDAKQEVQIINEDILPQHLGPSTYLPRSSWPPHQILLFLLVVPLCAIVCRILLSKRLTEASKPELAAQKKAGQKALAALGALDQECSLEEVRKTITSYLSDKFIISADTLTPRELASALGDRVKDYGLIQEVAALLNELERLVYSGLQTSAPGETKVIIKKAEELILRLEHSAKSHRLRFRSISKIFLTLCILSCSQQPTTDPTPFVVNGNSLYEQGKFIEAAAEYEKAISSGANNGHLYYNLGNSYFRMAQWGKAIACYRQALIELPRNPDLRSNLELARKHTVDSLPADTQALGQISSWLLHPKTFFSAQELTIALVALYFLFWLIVALQPLFAAAPISRYLLFSSGGISLLLLILLFFVRINARGTPEFALQGSYRSLGVGVITSDEVNVSSGDSDQFQIIFVLHQGTEVDIGNKRKGWVQILLPDKRSGWVRQEHIWEI